jgi:hypothetical protein
MAYDSLYTINGIKGGILIMNFSARNNSSKPIPLQALRVL